MYEKFERLCKEKGITPYKVSRDTGIATATLSDWKSGRSKPKVDKLKILADYFGVSIEYFLE
ncbi:helix-turn-helix domain-containing protein [Hungatella hathewayi]|uniref:helix-turn-helix domain-containing protein n=1 Tax=Hungatella hathewayi TaxID=154046 RepID=UPI0011DD19D6|nr:helix-turn-helix transcriptional regulator [Hungatella hathewayi]